MLDLAELRSMREVQAVFHLIAKPKSDLVLLCQRLGIRPSRRDESIDLVCAILDHTHPRREHSEEIL